PGDESERVKSLRRSIEERLKIEIAAEREGWIQRYREVQGECLNGDPILGLRRVLDLPPPPPGADADDSLPLVSDLFNTLGARGESAMREIGAEVEDTPQQAHAEQRLEQLFSDMKGVLAACEPTLSRHQFEIRLDDLTKRLEHRADERAQARAERLRRENL